MSKLPADITSKSFLVVDDYETMRTMVTEELKSMGVTKIATCNSGNEAMAYIKSKANTSEKVEVLMTDLMMDDGSGIDLVKGLRADERFKKLPILMITSKAEVGFVVSCIQAGVNTYIVKPWKTEDLLKKIIDTVSKAK